MLDAVAWADAEDLVRELIGQILAPYGVGAEVTYVRGRPAGRQRAGLDRAARAGPSSAVLGERGRRATPQSLGGEDFAWYLEDIPGAMGRLGTRTPGGPTYDLHQGDLRIDERAIGGRRQGARRGRAHALWAPSGAGRPDIPPVTVLPNR